MARSGLYKSDVKKARDALVAQGQHPSVDAVRIALGNTGSKTTIHKYLKELDEDDGGADGRRASISEALQDLVARLAAQLQDDANAKIDAVHSQARQKEQEHTQAMDALQSELASLRQQLAQATSAVQAEQMAHAGAREALQREAVLRHTAAQQVIDFKERLQENAAHRQSLEEKHQHAREALEHYRASVKEQRDQDLRRHEQQVQQLQAELRQTQQSLIVKQEDIPRLNQEGARLVSDLSHAQKALFDEQATGRRLTQQLEALPAAQQRCTILELQLLGKETLVTELRDQWTALREQDKVRDTQVQALQLAVTAAEAKLQAQQAAIAQWRLAVDRGGSLSQHDADPDGTR